MNPFFRWLIAGLMALGGLAAQAAQLIQQTNTTQCVDANLAIVACSSDATAPTPFEFTAGGIIRLGNLCLDAGTDTTNRPQAKACVPGQASQQWRIDQTLLRSANNLCLRNASPWGLYTGGCAYNANQSWRVATKAAGNAYTALTAWPQILERSTAVAGAVLTALEAQKVVGWIYNEMKIVGTPWCWRDTYNRSAETRLPGCASGKDLSAGICYDQCRSGYSAVGAVCWGSCPSGYRDNGAVCQSTQPLSYRPGSTCTNRKLGICWATQMNSCRDGYLRDTVTQTCWLKDPTIAKASYGRGNTGSLPDVCSSGRELQAGLCYDKPRDNYNCTVTSCQASCASGSQQCGPGACTNSASACARGVANQVVATALMVTALATEGAAGEARVALTALNTALSHGANAYDVVQLYESLYAKMAAYMAWSETNLAAASNATVEAAVAARYSRGSATYRMVAREWAYLQLAVLIGETAKDVVITYASLMDPIGVVGVINAFALPTCSQHTSFPN